MRRTLMAVAAGWSLVAYPTETAAQVPPAGTRPGQAGQQAAQDTVKKTPLELARERLLRLNAVGADAPLPDSLLADSLLPDSLRLPFNEVVFEEGGPPRGAAGGGELVPRDATARALLGLPGYVTTEYTAAEARYDAETGRLDLRLQPEVMRLGNRLSADSTITYLDAQGLMCASGRPTGSGPGLKPIVADSLCYYVEGERVVAFNAETELTEGALWRTRIERSDLIGDSVFGRRAIFTDCDIPWHEGPHYHFAARELKVVNQEWLVARDVTLNFQDVPVFWLPFMVQGLNNDRRSGILMPRFGVNDIARQSSSYNRKIEDLGFYWAISDYLGLQMSMDLVSNDHTALNGFFDYKFNRQFLSGALAFSNYWKSEGGRDFTLRTNHSWRADERTDLRVDATYTSSVDFIRKRSYSPDELSRTVASNAGVQRRFDWGNASLSARRQQFLADGRTTMTLPDLSVSVSSLELFPGASGALGDATWNGSFQGRAESRTPGTSAASLRQQDTRDVTGNLSSNFSMGQLQLRQTAAIKDEVLDPRSFAVDSLEALPGRSERRLDWTTALSYSQRLIGTSTLTPSLSVRGSTLQGDTTGGQSLAAPTTVNLGASLRTDLFGFWPGAGPFERIRHKITPNFDYSWSPAPTVTDRQREVFNARETREGNTLSIGLNQTFEAKYHPEDVDSTAVADSTDAEALAAAEPAARADGEPTRLPPSRTVTLLAINTNAVMYDFVAAREEGRGFTTDILSNSIQSDLLRGLQLRVEHDLFAEELGEGGSVVVDGKRKLAPHLSRVTAGFRLDNNSWLFRKLLGGGGTDSIPGQGSAALAMPEDSEAAPPTDYGDSEYGLIGTRRRDAQLAPSADLGAWDASLDFSINRPRADTNLQESSLVRARVNFQPTLLWSVNWSTSYSLSEGEFADHFLTLTRRLHDWDANFDFVKAQNGNFSFQFRVQLRANPDIKVDYEQRSQLDLTRRSGDVR